MKFNNYPLNKCKNFGYTFSVIFFLLIFLIFIFLKFYFLYIILSVVLLIITIKKPEFLKLLAFIGKTWSYIRSNLFSNNINNYLYYNYNTN